MEVYNANFPDVTLLDYSTDNPKLYSNNELYSIEFGLSPICRYDFEEYGEFIKSAIHNFRTSNFYRHYKNYLYSLGINKCAFHPYIQNTIEEDVGTLEMHHCMLTIWDIATLITEHYLNSLPPNIIFTEFDLSEVLKIEHINNNIPIVFLCKDCHKKYHNGYLYVEPEQIFGNYIELINKYNRGWNTSLLQKIYKYLNKSLDSYYNRDYIIKNREKLLQLRDKIENFSINNITEINNNNILLQK